VEIRRFIGAQASEDELRRCYGLYVADGAETFPGFPPLPFDTMAASWRSGRYFDLGPRHVWAAWEGARLLGFGTITYPDRHMPDWAMPKVIVDEAHRRRGIGTALLRELVAGARAEGRTTLGYEQVRFGTDGEHWARAVGFANVQRRSWQMLHVADVDPALWDVPAPAGFRLEQWADAAPDALVAAFAAARNAIADAPYGDSTYREPEWTVAAVRQAETDLRDAGDDARYVVAVHEETGAVAALTSMVLRPGHVELCWQRDTVVVADHRGLGLGRVVKAAMMRGLLAEIPDLGKVITTTASDNAYMIRVNEQIGYAHYADIGTFEASVEQVGAALGMSSNTNIPGPRREQELEGA
jgi:mycothiol synthase